MHRLDAAPVERDLEALALPARVLGELHRGRGYVLRGASVPVLTDRRPALAGKPHASDAHLGRLDSDRPDSSLDRCSSGVGAHAFQRTLAPGEPSEPMPARVRLGQD